MSISKRNIPALKAVPVLTSSASSGVSRKYTLKLITPMFGGGAEAGVIDQQMPIRASSIRGHLRFWWRLLNRHRFVEAGRLNVAEMRAAESAVWGDTQRPSPVDLVVRLDAESVSLKKCGQWKQYTRDNGDFGVRYDWDAPFNQLVGIGHQGCMPLPYVLFPFAGNAPKREHGQFPPTSGATALLNAAFDLYVIYDPKRMPALTFESEVVQTADTWIRWGGVGARTRRGLGVLEIVGNEGESAMNLVPKGCGLMVGRSCGRSPADAIKAWSQVVFSLLDFRQRRYRNSGPGRTKWPEPDSIRELTGYSARLHADPINPAAVGTFPRGWLGLPIVFHFQSTGRSAGDPPDITLEPFLKIDPNENERGRMASPVFLRPIRDSEGHWRPALLQIPVDHLQNMKCRLHAEDTELMSEMETSNSHIVQCEQLWGSRTAKAQPIADFFPATDSQAGGNAIVAFTRFLKKFHGFEWAN